MLLLLEAISFAYFYLRKGISSNPENRELKISTLDDLVEEQLKGEGKYLHFGVTEFPCLYQFVGRSRLKMGVYKVIPQTIKLRLLSQCSGLSNLTMFL